MFQIGRPNRTIWATLFFLLGSAPAFPVSAQEGRDLEYWKKIMHIQEQGEQAIPHRIEKDISPSIKLMMPGGAFPSWCPSTNKITYTKMVKNTYEVFVMDPDGRNAECLTCDKPALQGCRHRGQSYWHPSGRFIVFSAESAQYPRKGIGVTHRPGLGRNFNVWLMTADGKNFFQLSDYPDNWGVIETKFSHDGNKIYWNEEYSMELHPKGKPEDPVPHPGSYWGKESIKYRKGEELCAWRVVVADVSFEGGNPIISNIRKISPPPGFTAIEANGFTPDDKGFVWSLGNLKETRGRAFWGEIYVSDLDGKNWKRLTNTPWKHNEDPAYSPDGKKIVYKEATKGKGMPSDGMEIFLMDADGSNRVQLTHFSDPGYPEYRADWMQITEFSWSPNGKKIVYGMARGDKEFPKIFINSDLYLLTLPSAE
jgi:Tol biopolymer transport system component